VPKYMVDRLSDRPHGRLSGTAVVAVERGVELSREGRDVCPHLEREA
jgi:hypothetical protein